MNWAAWLMSLAAPLAGRVLLSIGLGTVTFVGLSAAVSGLLSAAKASAQGLLPEVAQILALAGVFQALSIIAGGVVTSLALISLKRFAANVTP